VTVREAVTVSGIEIIPASDSLLNNQIRQFNCIANYSDGSLDTVTTQTTWSLSPGLAGSIDSTGVFTADQDQTGTEVITAVFGGFESQATVVIHGVSLTKIEISPDTVLVSNEQTVQYICTAHYSDQSTQDVTAQASWSNSPGIAGSIATDGKFTVDYQTYRIETITATFNGEADSTIVIITGMLTVSEGSFNMGSLSGSVDEQPVNSVYMSTYEIDMFEVTNLMYVSYLQEGYDLMNIHATTISVTDGQMNELIDLDATGCQISFVSDKFIIESGKENYPVICVTWYGADAYAARYGKRLPTEAEWEKAARGTDSRTYPWGDTPPTVSYCNFNENIGYSIAIGQYSPLGDSPAGCSDMAGNVSEWVNDWYDATFYSLPPSSDPTGPVSGTYRVLRGGNWFTPAFSIRCSARGSHTPDYASYHIGFRCAR
jgi:formylglycine-generating enzyme required for sulfatase activity